SRAYLCVEMRPIFESRADRGETAKFAAHFEERQRRPFGTPASAIWHASVGRLARQRRPLGAPTSGHLARQLSGLLARLRRTKHATRLAWRAGKRHRKTVKEKMFHVEHSEGKDQGGGMNHRSPSSFF